MDGSTGNAGRITSATYSFLARVSYTLEAQVSGNQRGRANDSVVLGLLNIDALGETTGTMGSIASSSPLGPFTLSSIPLPGAYRLFTERVGGDNNIGAIIDHFVLRDDRPPVVPEPARLLVSSLALLAAGVARRRR